MLHMVGRLASTNARPQGQATRDVRSKGDTGWVGGWVKQGWQGKPADRERLHRMLWKGAAAAQLPPLPPVQRDCTAGSAVQITAVTASSNICMLQPYKHVRSPLLHVWFFNVCVA